MSVSRRHCKSYKLCLVTDKLSFPNPPAARNEVLLYQFSWTHVFQHGKYLLMFFYFFSLFSTELMRARVLFFVKSFRDTTLLWTREASCTFLQWYFATSLLHITSILETGKFRILEETLEYRSQSTLWMWSTPPLPCAGHIQFHCLWSEFEEVIFAEPHTQKNMKLLPLLKEQRGYLFPWTIFIFSVSISDWGTFFSKHHEKLVLSDPSSILNEIFLYISIVVVWSVQVGNLGTFMTKTSENKSNKCIK